MNKYLNHIVFKKISHLTNYLKIESFVVGGFVRDCLINEKQNFKISILFVIKMLLL